MKTSLAVSITSFSLSLLLLSAPGVSQAQNLFVANFGNNTIDEINSSGTVTVFASAGLNGPAGLAFDSSGNLYVANSIGNTIEKFTPNGIGSVFANSGVSTPDGLAFDSSGNLYVANKYNNTIEKFTPGGTGSVFASTGMNGPAYMAFQPVPEPSTWAMLAMGIGVILGGLRLRRPSS